MKHAPSCTALFILFFFPAAAQVGIGTNTPLARLHVSDSSVLFSASGPAAVPANNPPLSGEGRRLMWYTDKAAFRVGYVNGTQWDADSTGYYSFASGYGTLSNGSASTAMGLGSKAYGQGAVSLGLLNLASNDGATALGYGSVASGLYAMALGFFTVSSGVTSTALGYQSSATASQSVSIGTSTIASGFASTAMGTFASTNSYMGSFVIGDNSTATLLNSSLNNQMSMRFAGGYRFFANTGMTTGLCVLPGSGNVGIGTFSPLARLHITDSSVVFTANSPNPFPPANIPVSGQGRRMLWYADKSAFRAGYVGGVQWDQTNVGEYSMAMGINTTSSGYGATALGGYNTASGDFSTALGNTATASGDYSVAIGSAVTASGNYSFAMGSSVSTFGKGGSFVIGDSTTAGTLISTIGNQMSMRFAGGYRLYSNVLLTTGVNLAAGGGSWSSVSDRRKKENFQTINNEDILQKVATLPLSNWNYKSQPATQRHIGPMAQDFYAAFHLDGIGADTTINTTDIDGVNMAAIQALEKRTRDLQQANTDLQNRVAQLETQNHELSASVADLQKDHNTDQQRLNILQTQMQQQALDVNARLKALERKPNSTLPSTVKD